MVKKLLNPVVAATVVMILYTIMPVMTVVISAFITTYAYMIMCAVLFVFIILSGGINRLSAMAFLLIPVAVYVACTFSLRLEAVTLVGYRGLLLLLTVAAGYYFMYYRDDAIPVLSEIIIFAVLITAITTVIGVIRFPEASRKLAAVLYSDNLQNVKFSWNNIGSYDFVYTCVLLYPILILAYKQRRISRAAFLSLFLLLMGLIISAEYTIALLLFMITSILFFVDKKTTANRLLIFGIVVSAIFFLFQSVLENFFLWLSNVFESDIFSERLSALAGGVNGVENSESNRIELYQISLRSFAASPVFGNIFKGGFAAGGHSFILDTLANYGIFGGVTIAVIYKNIYKKFFAPFKNSPGYGFVLWTFMQAIVLSTVNTGFWLNVLALFAPVLFSLVYRRYGDEGYYEDSLDS